MSCKLPHCERVYEDGWIPHKTTGIHQLNRSELANTRDRKNSPTGRWARDVYYVMGCKLDLCAAACRTDLSPAILNELNYVIKIFCFVLAILFTNQSLVHSKKQLKIKLKLKPFNDQCFCEFYPLAGWTPTTSQMFVMYCCHSSTFT